MTAKFMTVNALLHCNMQELCHLHQHTRVIRVAHAQLGLP